MTKYFYKLNSRTAVYTIYLAKENTIEEIFAGTAKEAVEFMISLLDEYERENYHYDGND